MAAVGRSNVRRFAVRSRNFTGQEAPSHGVGGGPADPPPQTGASELDARTERSRERRIAHVPDLGIDHLHAAQHARDRSARAAKRELRSG